MKHPIAKFSAAAFVGLASFVTAANASVFMDAVYINPPGGADSTKEYIQLKGTPGKNLDGYAIALCNGTEAKLHDIGDFLDTPNEIDEFFSLDGLSLGANGLLVIGVGFDFAGDYPGLLVDSNFQNWLSLWNGNDQDPPNQLQNDGSNTILLIRNRPGRTQQDPNNPGGTRWAKTNPQDAELFTPVEDPPGGGVFWDQWGDGELDRGNDNGQGGNTRDLVGATTPADATDDLEIVDEISYEHGVGWEYDTDGRHVDDGSTHDGLPRRHVHALDDPQGFNADVIIRVDYRTTGDGWTPAPGGTGEMNNGNNWQDTATEQWIRGESVECFGGCPGVGPIPQHYLDNGANANPDAIQPYLTNVPLWLDDGQAPDYVFTQNFTYQILAGRVNKFAVPYIPGDADRDGDCDQDDIGKIADVFGDDDWIFSNAYDESTEGNEVDPAIQTKPWDVDATGDEGVEPSDLQWTLNFQGDTTGHVVGVRYDSTTPAADGVPLNSNAGVNCTVSVDVHVPAGRPATELNVGDMVELTVRGQVTAGGNQNAGEQNGIMQYVHDVTLSNGGVFELVDVQAVGVFATTRDDIQSPQGANGDMGVTNVNGYTTAFDQGLSGTADMYRITLEAVALGGADVDILPAAEPKFAASTPEGLKIGHTASHGDPASSIYPAAVSLAVTTMQVPGDLTGDGEVNLADQAMLPDCLTGPDNGPVAPGCQAVDFNTDDDVDLDDWQQMQSLIAMP